MRRLEHRQVATCAKFSRTNILINNKLVVKEMNLNDITFFFLAGVLDLEFNVLFSNG